MPRRCSKNCRSEAKRLRDKKKAPDPPAHPALAGPLSDAQQVVLALWLWKSFWCHGALSVGTGGAKDLPTFDSVRLGEKAIELAKKYGVKDEFLALLFELKLYRITLTPME